MKIGIDASRLTEEKRTGTGNYLYNVIKYLSVEDKSNTFIVYFREKPSEAFIRDLFNQNPNFTHKIVKKTISWTHLSLAISVMTDHVDVLFCPWHTVPVLCYPKVRLIGVIHDMQLRSASPFFTILTILFSSKVIAVSNATREDILKYLPFVGNKVKVIYEGVDLNVFRRVDASLQQEVQNKYAIKSPYLVYVGTIGMRKNIPNMINGFAKYRIMYANNTQIQFVLAGTVSSEYRNIYELPSSIGEQNTIKFLGYVPDIDLPALISGSVGLMYASTAEGFGLPILEAMACGVPVLTSNVSSMKEIAKDAAVLVEPQSTESIASGIKRLIDDSQFLIEKGNVAVKEYSWDQCVKQIMKVIQNHD